MKEFKVGSKVKIISKTKGYQGFMKVGDIGQINKFYVLDGKNQSASMECEAGLSSCFHNLNNVELVKPKWTIYNNTLTWLYLSDKQKGKFLLANHDGVEIIGLECISIPKPVVFNCDIIAYQAVKPKPTMAELFAVDLNNCNAGIEIKVSEQMTVKGWAKK